MNAEGAVMFRDRMVVGFTTTYAIIKKLRVQILLMARCTDTTLCGKVCQ